jgi:sec-independent protein translocase protein TatA
LQASDDFYWLLQPIIQHSNFNRIFACIVMQIPLLMFGLGTGEIILILLVIIIFFGAKKIPELARGMGRGIREFKEASQEVKKEIETSVQEKPAQKEDKA